MHERIALAAILAALAFTGLVAIGMHALGSHPLAELVLATCAGFDAALLLTNLLLWPAVRDARLQAKVLGQLLQAAHTRLRANGQSIAATHPSLVMPATAGSSLTFISNRATNTGPTCARCGAPCSHCVDIGWFKACACLPRGPTNGVET